MRTSECSDVMFDAPGIACNRDLLELCPLPRTLPPRTSREPCFVSMNEFSASAAASCKNLLWRHIVRAPVYSVLSTGYEIGASAKA